MKDKTRNSKVTAASDSFEGRHLAETAASVIGWDFRDRVGNVLRPNYREDSCPDLNDPIHERPIILPSRPLKCGEQPVQDTIF